MLGIETELMIFVHAVGAGVTVVLAYELIRILRRIVPHNLLAVSAEDFLFWLGVSFFLFIKIYGTSDGSIRWYFVLGVVVGMIIAQITTFFAKKLLLKIKKSIDKSRESR